MVINSWPLGSDSQHFAPFVVTLCGDFLILRAISANVNLILKVFNFLESFNEQVSIFQSMYMCNS